jgi:hypothetical protein
VLVTKKQQMSTEHHAEDDHAGDEDGDWSSRLRMMLGSIWMKMWLLQMKRMSRSISRILR